MTRRNLLIDVMTILVVIAFIAVNLVPFRSHWRTPIAGGDQRIIAGFEGKMRDGHIRIYGWPFPYTYADMNGQNYGVSIGCIVLNVLVGIGLMLVILIIRKRVTAVRSSLRPADDLN